MRPGVYTRTYSRALYKYLNNGFFARDLDEDDLMFIERIREKGCIESSNLSQLVRSHHWDAWNTGAWLKYASDEERDYWKHRWVVEPGVERGRAPPSRTPERPPGTTPAAKTRIANKIAVTHAREMMWREYRETQARLRDERERRILANMLADMEWDANEALNKAVKEAQLTPAEPVVEVEVPKRKLDYRKPFTYPRAAPLTDERNHYVPEWRRPKKLKPKRRPKVETPPEPPPPPPKPVELPPAIVQHYNDLENAKATIKKRILAVIRGTTNQWSIAELMNAMDFHDRNFVIMCADELAGGGYIGKNS